MKSKHYVRLILVLFLFLLLTACGGGGGGGSDAADDTNGDSSDNDSVLAGTGTEIDMWAGGIASSADGVTVEILEGSWEGTVEVIFEEAETTNAPVEDGFPASDVYVIRLLGFKTGETTVPFKVTMPVETMDLPTPIDEYAFAVETYDEGTGQWERNDAMAQYDENTSSVTFWANHFSKKRVVYVGDDPNVELKKYVYISPNEKFYITYFSPAIFDTPSNHLPPANTEWQGSGTATDPEAPDYIEDLGKALERALTYLTTKVIQPDGYLLFNDPTHDAASLEDHAISVTVAKIPAKGDTRLGGPVRIDTALKNWHEMKVVAAHELVHFLCDQHYTGTGARLNRWFFEAIAELYGTRAAGYSKKAYTTYFSNYYNYLKVSLDASDETSYYGIGDFLYWLEDHMNGQVASGVVASNYTWDITGLNNLLKEWGSSLGDEYTQYVLECTVGDHDYRANNIKISPSLNFSSSILYKKYKFKQPHLSARHVRVYSNVLEDGMLVAESGVHYQYGGGIPLKTYSYTDATIPVADIDNNIEKTTEVNKPIVVEHFGKKGTAGVEESIFHQIIINPLIGDAVVGSEYYFDYYILVPPKTEKISDSKVTWTFPSATVYGGADSPIKGFYVYSDGVQLTDNPLPKTSRLYEDTRIRSNSDVQVTVVDKYDNEWPEVEEGELKPNWELLVDLNQNSDDHAYETDIIEFEKWIPVTVSPGGSVSIDYTFQETGSGWTITHRVWGSGTYQKEKLNIACQWESSSVYTDEIKRIDRHVTGNFNGVGEFDDGYFDQDYDTSEGNASATETWTAIPIPYDGYEPNVYRATGLHPNIWLDELRPIN